MIIREKLGSINTSAVGNRTVDWLLIEWFETSKRILHKRTTSGKEIVLKFLQADHRLAQGDIVYEDEQSLVAIDIIPCDTIVIHPANLYEMASVCYEIGNKHLPLFYDDGAVLVPYEAPLLRLLQASGFNIHQEKRKLLHSLKTTVTPHGESKSLFSKIMQLTTSSQDA
jgi:urease accessory protein